MYSGYWLDPNRGSDISFFTLMVPSLNEIRNGHYWGLLTSSLIDSSILFLVWGICWFWYFGHTFENRVSIPFYIFVIISSIIFPQLFEILIFETTGYGSGGITCALFGFVWLMSAYEPFNGWVITYTQKLSFLAFILICIFLDSTKIYEIGIGALIGGLFWGVFVAAVSRFVKIRALRIAIPALVLGVFLIPVFWAPWQISWLLVKAEMNRKRSNFAEAKELYSRVLKKDSANIDGKQGLIGVLYDEADQYYDRRDFEKSRALCTQILQLDHEYKPAKETIQIIDHYQEYREHYQYGRYEEARKSLLRILEIEPEDKNTKDLLKHVELLQAFIRYYDQKDLDKAKESLIQMLEIYPDDEWAKKTLKIIQEQSPQS